MPQESDAVDDLSPNIRPQFDAVWALVEPFCQERLNEEYVAMCRRLLIALAQEQPSPLIRGTPETWAAGVVRAVGYNNFLDDPDTTPYMKATEIDKAFGVTSSTSTSRSRKIREVLDIQNFDPKWTLPSMMGVNPMAYLISVNGMIMDVRTAPPEVQQEALRKGLVPPGVLTNVQGAGPTQTQLFELQVFILSGMLTPKFVKKNNVISRTILIRGDQTLDHLHHAIFEAFDRFDEHMYEFNFGTGSDDLDAPRYGRASMQAAGVDNGGRPMGNAETTQLDSLGLSEQSAFGYLFDFGDEWWHQVNVIKIHEQVPPGKYPVIKDRVGKSPPQYPEPEELD